MAARASASPSPSKVLDAALAASTAATEASKAATVAASAAINSVHAADKLELQLNGVSDRLRRVEEHRESVDSRVTRVEKSMDELNETLKSIKGSQDEILAVISASKFGARVFEWIAGIAIGVAGAVEVARYVQHVS